MITTDIIQANNSTHQEIDKLMTDLQQKRMDDEIIDTLIFVEHHGFINKKGVKRYLFNISA